MHESKSRDVDLEIGSAVPELPEIRSETLAVDHLVLAMRAGHPLSLRQLTLERYAQAQHVIVSRRGRLRDRIDEVLEHRGLERHVVAAAPTSTAALYFVQQSDLVTVVPERMCRSTVDALGLCTAPLPMALPDIQVVAAWHQRYDNDRAHRWLREVIKGAIDPIERPGPGQRRR